MVILWSKKPLKFLVFGMKRKSGRNNKGFIVIRCRRGGFRRRYRFVDFRRCFLFNCYSLVLRFECDPNRNSYIVLVCYSSGVLSYILCVENLKLGDLIFSYNLSSIFSNPGNFLRLGFSFNGALVSNVEIRPSTGASLARAAGSFVQIIRILDKLVIVKLNSGEVRYLSSFGFCSLGIVSNSFYKYNSFLKAGFSRNMGKSPHVRGVAMNPVDHPHGGGEGRSSSGRIPVSFTGIYTKGKKTIFTKKKLKYKSKFVISDRRGRVFSKISNL